MAKREKTTVAPPPDASFPLSSMIDVVFLLLIFFILTQKPIVEDVQMNVQLPAPDPSNNELPAIPITVEVNKYERDNFDEIDARLAATSDPNEQAKILSEVRAYYVLNGSVPIPLDKLRTHLTNVAKGDADSTIMIKCDPSAKHRKLVLLLDLCSDLELNSLQLVENPARPYVPDPVEKR